MNWIDNYYPPDCLGVILFVVEYRYFELKRIIDDETICLGYYSEYHHKYYIEHPSTITLGIKKYEIETDLIKVIAWTLAPRITNQLKNILKENEKFYKL